MRVNRVTFFVLVILLVVFVLPSDLWAFPGGGSGTAGDPYQVTNWEELHALRDNLSAHYILMNDLGPGTTGYDDYASPTADGGQGWEPIGEVIDPDAGLFDGFTGVFDGDNHTIYSLYINRPEGIGVGLFAVTEEDAQVKNVGLEDVDITSYIGVGGLIGAHLSSGDVTNTYVTGEIYGVSGSEAVGGLIGVAGDVSIVSNSHANQISVRGDSEVGGLIGVAEGTLTDLHVTGEVQGDKRVGGLIGELEEASLVNSYADVTVDGRENGRDIGGLVGESYRSSIDNSHATGDVSGKSQVGGLVGRNYEGAGITQSYATGKVTVSSNDGVAAGGLVGQNNGPVINSFARGKVTMEGLHGGGLAGINLEDGLITNSYSTGEVTGGGSSLGGLLGTAVGGSDVSSSFWDIQTSGKSNSAGGTGRTTAQMKEFAGFDNAGWEIGEKRGYENDGYPYLSGSTPTWLIAEYTEISLKTTEENNISLSVSVVSMDSAPISWVFYNAAESDSVTYRDVNFVSHDFEGEPDTKTFIVMVPDTGAINSIVWTSKKLAGEIPAEFGELTELTTLNLLRNNFSGSIPAELGNLTKLERLSLLENSLSGEIPSELGNLTKLTRLAVYENDDLTGSLPESLGNLSELESFNFSSTGITGDIPASFSNLTKLEYFNGNATHISGYEPGVFATQPNLESIWLTSGGPLTPLSREAIDNILTDLVTSLDLPNRVIATVGLQNNEPGGVAARQAYETLLDAGWSVNVELAEHTVTTRINGKGRVILDGVTELTDGDVQTILVGDTLHLEAVPDDFWYFAGWDTDLSATDPQASLFVDEDKEIGANFEAFDTSIIDVTVSGEGTVYINGDTALGPTTVLTDDTVTITAEPKFTWYFDTWGGDLSGSDTTVELFVDADKSITATFTEHTTHELTVDIFGEGDVYVGDGQVSEKVVGDTVNVIAGDTAYIEALPAQYWFLKEWGGAVSGAELQVKLFVDSDTTISATFERIVHTTTFTVIGDGQIEIEGDTLVVDGDTFSSTAGETIALEAKPGDHSYFVEWSFDLGSDTAVDLFVNADLFITATFDTFGITNINRPFPGALVGDTLTINFDYYGRAGDTLQLVKNGTTVLGTAPAEAGEQNAEHSFPEAFGTAGPATLSFQYLTHGDLLLDSKEVTVNVRLTELHEVDSDSMSFKAGRFQLQFPDTTAVTVDLNPLLGPNESKINSANTKAAGRYVENQIESTIFEVKSAALTDAGGTITISYSEVAAKLSGHEENLRIYRLDMQEEEWSDAEITHIDVDTDVHRVRANVQEFSIFAVLSSASVSTVADDLGEVYSWPNPYLGPDHAEIFFAIPDSYGNRGTLEIYNIRGHRVYSRSWTDADIVDGANNAIRWVPRVASGTYIYVLSGGGQTSSETLTIIR